MNEDEEVLKEVLKEVKHEEEEEEIFSCHCHLLTGD